MHGAAATAEIVWKTICREALQILSSYEVLGCPSHNAYSELHIKSEREGSGPLTAPRHRKT
jgi:hypothetical protein